MNVQLGLDCVLNKKVRAVENSGEKEHSHHQDLTLFKKGRRWGKKMVHSPFAARCQWCMQGYLSQAQLLLLSLLFSYNLHVAVPPHAFSQFDGTAADILPCSERQTRFN